MDRLGGARGSLLGLLSRAKARWSPFRRIQWGAIEFRIRDCFAIKDSLKERGYRWDGSRKVWTKSFEYDAARKAEIREQLLQEIQGLEALGVPATQFWAKRG